MRPILETDLAITVEFVAVRAQSFPKAHSLENLKGLVRRAMSRHRSSSMGHIKHPLLPRQRAFCKFHPSCRADWNPRYPVREYNTKFKHPVRRREPELVSVKTGDANWFFSFSRFASAGEGRIIFRNLQVHDLFYLRISTLAFTEKQANSFFLPACRVW